MMLMITLPIIDKRGAEAYPLGNYAALQPTICTRA
jgi:hypothetical protein